MPTARAAAENFPGVSITPVQGQFLKARLAEGPVTATVTVEGAYFKTTFPGVYAGEDGASPAVAVLTGHMFELGVMDNASGVMASHWAGATVRRIRKARGLKRFSRGWRHFHSQECYGVLALGTRHPELVRPMFAHVNIDAMGTYRAPVELRPGLAASNGFAGFLMRRCLEKAAARTGYPIDTRGGFETNCTLLAEPALGGVPTCLVTMRDFWWHSSEDRNGLLPMNPVSAATTAAAVGAWLLFCVSAGRPRQAVRARGAQAPDRRHVPGDRPVAVQAHRHRLPGRGRPPPPGPADISPHDRGQPGGGRRPGAGRPGPDRSAQVGSRPAGRQGLGRRDPQRL
ncbi:MAG: hypothetical protein ABIF71_15065 [Planctomycetota bacterium]